MVWPLLLSLALFGLSAVFLIIGDVRKGGNGLGSLVPEELRGGITRLVTSEAWIRVMGNGSSEHEDYEDDLVGDSCSGTAGRIVRAEATGGRSGGEVASNTFSAEQESDTPSMTLSIGRKVKSTRMRNSKFGMGEGGMSHDSLQETVKSQSTKRLPYVIRDLLSASSESGTGAWTWDINAHSRRWPVLENVRELPYSKGKREATMSGHVFVDEDRDPSLLNFQAPMDEEVEGSTRAHYHYECNYRVYEGIVGGKKDTNLLSPDGSFSWKSFTFSDMSSNATEELGKLGVNMSVAPAPSMWLLPTGTALQLRYAESHRSRLQLAGRANYTLFPPSALPSLSLYPSGHFSRWQSQVQLYDPDPGSQETHFPEFHSWLQRTESGSGSGSKKDGSGEAAMTVSLEAGDMLYIPPFWSVHSEAVKGLSAVLDVPSHSAEQMALMEAWHMRLPLQEPALYQGAGTGTGTGTEGKVEVSFLERVVAAKVYLVHILSRCPSLHGHVKSPRHFARHLYQSRYSALYAPKSLFMKPYRSFVEGSQHASTPTPAEEGARPSGFQCFREREEEEVAAAVRRLNADYLVSRAEFVASSVEDPAVPLGARLVWLEGYAERIAAWAMAAGPSSSSLASDRHEDGLKFLLSCLQMDSYVEVEEEGGAIHLDTNEGEND